MCSIQSSVVFRANCCHLKVKCPSECHTLLDLDTRQHELLGPLRPFPHFDMYFWFQKPVFLIAKMTFVFLAFALVGKITGSRQLQFFCSSQNMISMLFCLLCFLLPSSTMSANATGRPNAALTCLDPSGTLIYFGNQRHCHLIGDSQ